MIQKKIPNLLKLKLYLYFKEILIAYYEQNRKIRNIEGRDKGIAAKLKTLWAFNALKLFIKTLEISPMILYSKNISAITLKIDRKTKLYIIIK